MMDELVLPASWSFDVVPSIPVTTTHLPTHTPTLTLDELEQLRRRVGPTASILAHTIAKLYVCERGSSVKEYQWSGVSGALVLIVDRTQPTSKAIQIYTLHPIDGHSTHECVFSIQLYESMAYLAPNHLFHTFEIDQGLIGLSFTNVDEAHEFLVKVRQHIPTHGSVERKGSSTAKPKKASFLQRIFGSSSSSTKSSSDESVPIKSDDIGISTPTSVVKLELPHEWQTLFKNAAAISNHKQELVRHNSAELQDSRFKESR